MEYIILSGDYIYLSEQVTEKLKEGFEICGSPYSVNNVHYQAVIKQDIQDGGVDNLKRAVKNQK